MGIERAEWVSRNGVEYGEVEESREADRESIAREFSGRTESVPTLRCSLLATLAGVSGKRYM